MEDFDVYAYGVISSSELHLLSMPTSFPNVPLCRNHPVPFCVRRRSFELSYCPEPLRVTGTT